MQHVEDVPISIACLSLKSFSVKLILRVAFYLLLLGMGHSHLRRRGHVWAVGKFEVEGWGGSGAE